MIEVVMTPEAQSDLTGIGNYIAVQLKNRAAARSVIKRIKAAVFGLRELPERGAPLAYLESTPVYRYLISGSYLIIYHTDKTTVKIDRIFNGRQNYLSVLFEEEMDDAE